MPIHLPPFLRVPVCLIAISIPFFGQEKLRSRPLAEFAVELKEVIPGKGSNAFREPSSADLAQFRRCMGLVFAGNTGSAGSCLERVNYTISVLSDPKLRRDYVIVWENRRGFRGLGTYIIDLNYLRNVVLEVPHPLYDAMTLEESVEVFQHAGLRAIFVSGTHRCSNLDKAAGCGGSVNACGSMMPYRISDAAHYDRNFFTAAHQALLSLNPQPAAISVHGNSEEPVVAELSDGTAQPAPADALVNRMRRSLLAHKVDTGSCNWQEDNPSRFQFCGQSNVQGRLSNGAVNGCAEQAHHSLGHFIQIEQRREMRDHPEWLLAVVREIFPANGPGARRN